MAFFDDKGNPCDKATWLALIQSPNRVVAYDELTIDGVPLIIFSRFSGLSGEVFETTVHGVAANAVHEKYHDMHVDSKDKATCLKEHARIKAAIEAGVDETAIQAIPEADQAKATVSRVPYKIRRIEKEAADAREAARLAALEAEPER
jgi:hypothetical protein